MKKSLIYIFVLFIVIIAIFIGVMLNAQSNERYVQNFNKEYEQFLGKTVLGTDVATLINKAMDSNEKNDVQKDEKNYYIDNAKNSIRVFVQLVNDGGYYSMEKIFSLNITEFVKNFNLQDFKCTKILYHEKTKLISEIYFDIIDN